MRRILITPRSLTSGHHPVVERMQSAGCEVICSSEGKQPDEEELLRLLPGCVGYLAGVEPVSARVLEAAKDLKVISRNGVGADNIDLGAAKRLGIVVCTANGANARGVAELTMAHLLALTRWIPFSDKGIKGGGWERRRGIELNGRTIGLIGCGNIGRLVAQFALGVDMKVLAYDVVPDSSFNPSADFRFTSLDDVIRRADVISLHCPALADAKPLIDQAAFAKMKKGVFLINTARAGLIDTAALFDALQSGQVAGAALDVFKTEPPAPDDPLVFHDRVIVSPHIGGFTDESVGRAAEVAADNLLAELNQLNQEG